MSSKSHESRADKKTQSESIGDQAASSSDIAMEHVAEASSEIVSEPDSRVREAEARIAALEVELAAARAELSAVNDKYLRKLADDVNFRKRMVRDKEEGQRFAVGALLGDLIPMLDDFDRAIGSAETLKDYAVFHDGISLIRRQLGQVLENKYGLKRIDSRGMVFDPNFHEAVAVEQGGTGDEATIAEEFLPAYCLHERLLRSAKVKVRMPAALKPSEEPEQSAAPESAAASKDIADSEGDAPSSKSE